MTKPVWCPKCFLRIAPYDRKTTYHRLEYHQHCYLKLVRDEAEQEATQTGRDAIVEVNEGFGRGSR